ncbi:unnamed protein product [Parascedosporium putredinis]|uniref:Putative phospholipase n=1 Tax=Parascedosporium putredinis TaxID=1442378 RepID=A0A9P1M7L2_9PEZI|nr:unnamed protein product [Parascedosporium putredinis]CAI7990717.1 unnamed protein product [Parascedosporium putredinis]
MLGSLSPVPSFPDYTGPYRVGTVDVEIPIDELYSPSPRPAGAEHVSTVAMRIFYPASLESTGKPPPAAIAYFPRHLHYTSIPAHKNADILPANTPNGRWPTVVFSHGLGGSRNAYSHVAGSLASHGTVVFCPEHRDGSAVTSFIRSPEKYRQKKKKQQQQQRGGGSSSSPSRLFGGLSNGSSGNAPKNMVVPYRRISHTVSPEMYAAREEQLRIRLWELGLIHDALLRMDRGESFTNMNASTLSLAPLAGLLHVHEPGAIIFAGHSFGSATTVQLVKSTYYADHPVLSTMDKAPLFTPEAGSEIRRQITDKTVTILLDIWVTPLIDPGFTPLFDLPMPAYDAAVPDAPGGRAILAVLSEQFYKWEDHLRVTARVFSPAPAEEVPSPELYHRRGHGKNQGQAQAATGDNTSDNNTDESSASELPPFPHPNLFYVQESAHLSQSDFGVLFPWLTKKMFSAVEPARAIRLNLRAQLQVLRDNGVPIARTCAADLADGIAPDAILVQSPAVSSSSLSNSSSGKEGSLSKKKHARAAKKHRSSLTAAAAGDLADDRAILDKSGECVVDHWLWIDGPTLFVGTDSESDSAEGRADQSKRRVEKTDKDMAEHMEPGLEEAAVVAARG